METIEGGRVQKVTILQGLPASGKSTWARKQVLKNPTKVVIVNRDSIREGLGKYWVPERESLVTLIEHDMIKNALIKEYDIIIDATNFNSKYLKDIINIIEDAEHAYRLIVNIEIKRFDISLNKAIFRDWLRGLKGGRKVGSKVIKSFYERYIENTK